MYCSVIRGLRWSCSWSGSNVCLKLAFADCSKVSPRTGETIEYAIDPANAVTNKNSTVSHTRMLTRDRRLTPRQPDKSRGGDKHDGRAFLGRRPLRLGSNSLS